MCCQTVKLCKNITKAISFPSKFIKILQWSRKQACLFPSAFSISSVMNLHSSFLLANLAGKTTKQTFRYSGSKKLPREKTSRNYKQTIILTGPSQITTFTSSTAYTHSSQRQNTDNKHTSGMSFRPSIAGCAERTLGALGKKTYLSWVNMQ